MSNEKAAEDIFTTTAVNEPSRCVSRGDHKGAYLSVRLVNAPPELQALNACIQVLEHEFPLYAPAILSADQKLRIVRFLLSYVEPRP